MIIIRILMFPAHSQKKIFSQDVSLELCLASSVENAWLEYRMLFPILVGSYGECVCVCMCMWVCVCVYACVRVRVRVRFHVLMTKNIKRKEKRKKRKKKRRKKKKFDVLNVSQHRIPRRTPLNTSVSVDPRSPASNVKRFTYFSFPFPRCSVDWSHSFPIDLMWWALVMYVLSDCRLSVMS